MTAATAWVGPADRVEDVAITGRSLTPRGACVGPRRTGYGTLPRMSFDANAAIETERLILTPLGPEDAEEMAPVLRDERLHAFIGGRPLTVDELRDD